MGVEIERERGERKRSERTAQQNVAFRETLRGREPEPETADDTVAALCSELRVQQSSAEQCSSGAAVPLSGHKWMCNHEHDRFQKRSLEDMSK